MTAIPIAPLDVRFPLSTTHPHTPHAQTSQSSHHSPSSLHAESNDRDRHSQSQASQADRTSERQDRDLEDSHDYDRDHSHTPRDRERVSAPPTSTTPRHTSPHSHLSAPPAHPGATNHNSHTNSHNNHNSASNPANLPPNANLHPSSGSLRRPHPSPPLPSPATVWPTELALPHSAPAYTSSFPLSPLPLGPATPLAQVHGHNHGHQAPTHQVNSQNRTSPLPQVKLEQHSPTWSEPALRPYQRDFIYPTAAYREEWPQAPAQAHPHSSQHGYQQQQLHQRVNVNPTHHQVPRVHANANDSYPSYNTPQYTYWASTPAYPTMAPNQDEKRRQAELNKARKHVCPVCDKRFNRPSSLNTHMSVHTGAKPYQCLREGCGRRFSVSSNLRRHERTHDARTRTTKAAPRPNFYYPTSNYYVPGHGQFDYSNASASSNPMAASGSVASGSGSGSSATGLRDYAVVGNSTHSHPSHTASGSGSGAAGISGNMGMGLGGGVSMGGGMSGGVVGQRRESAPGYYQTTPAASPTPQGFHKMST